MLLVLHVLKEPEYVQVKLIHQHVSLDLLYKELLALKIYLEFQQLEPLFQLLLVELDSIYQVLFVYHVDQIWLLVVISTLLLVVYLDLHFSNHNVSHVHLEP